MDAYRKIKNTYSKGSEESDSLGRELHERAKNSAAALGTPTTDSPEKQPVSDTPTDRINRGARYGDRSGEKRIDTSSMTKTLGSYKDGCDYVPKTGKYQLHEGEAVLTKDENPNADPDAVEDAMANHTPEEKDHFSRAMSHLHRGGLHKHLGIPEDQPIPMEKKQEAAKSSNPHVSAMGRLAVAMHGWKKK